MKWISFSGVNGMNDKLLLLAVCACVFSVGLNKAYSAEAKDKVISKPELKTVMGQPSYVFSNDVVTAALTLQGGQLGPVTFKLGDRQIEPYSVAPWWNEEVSEDVPNVARILRGDLFCLPFGLNLEPFNGEHHPVHGETANDKWTFEDFSKTSEATTLHVSMDVKVRPGRVDKWVVLPAGQSIVYQRDTISKMTGPMCFGHHAMLKIPDYQNAARFSASRWVHGQVATQPVELPENKGYSMLKTGAVFDSLTKVPTIFSDTPTADLTTYPRGKGFEDVVSLAADPAFDIAWNCVAFPKEGYVWFALRDPKVLASTMLWLSNGGRYYTPWNGRHINVLGIEDNTTFYHYGLTDAVGPNPHAQKGIKTFLDLKADKPLVVNYITGVAEIPGDFERVDSIKFSNNEMTLTAPNGKSIKVLVNLDFLNQ